LDFIPVLVTVDEENPGKMVEYAHRRVKTAAKHGINFVNLYFNPVLREKWKKTVQLIFPESIDPSDMMILFNFQGKFEEKERAVFRQLHPGEENPDRGKRGKEEKICSFMCNASYTSTSISLSVSSTIEPDVTKFKKILDDLRSFIY
jgi:hypothetical protein